MVLCAMPSSWAAIYIIDNQQNNSEPIKVMNIVINCKVNSHTELDRCAVQSIYDLAYEKESHSLFSCMYLANCNLTCECGFIMKFGPFIP